MDWCEAAVKVRMSMTDLLSFSSAYGMGAIAEKGKARNGSLTRMRRFDMETIKNRCSMEERISLKSYNRTNRLGRLVEQ